jgi:alpha 1,2-mannosyltransferase
MRVLLVLFLSLVVSKENAVIIVLCRNSDKEGIKRSIQQFEQRFNHKHEYPYVFLNDQEFTDEFKAELASTVSGPIEFGRLTSEEFGIPSHIDMLRAEKSMAEMKRKGVIYGDSLSYRKMCRFFSGYFYRAPLVQKYDYYWRIEPDVSFLCDIDYDPFTFLRENNKKYGFVITLREFMETIPTLFAETLNFLAKNFNLIKNRNLNGFILNHDRSYNGCHFWSNFEIGDLGFFRSELYQRYFDWLDRAGGFFYERWGDAPVHSIAAALFLDADQIHFFSDIGYEHPPFQHCPSESSMRSKCSCSVNKTFDLAPQSCLRLYKAGLPIKV